MTLVRRRDSLVIEFLDTCAPFDSTAFAITEQPNTIAAIATNGRGLMLIRAYAREFASCYDGSYNRTMLSIESSKARPRAGTHEFGDGNDERGGGKTKT
jgi:hypothetical protein